MTKDLTTGRPMGVIVRFALPVLLAMLFQQFYSLVDTLIVGRILGPEALAAVGSTGSLNFMVIGFCSGVCAGFAIPMAQAFGAKNENDLKTYIGNSLWLCAVFSAVLSVVTGVFCKQILRLMNTPEDILDRAYSYIVVIFWGIPVTYLYNMLACMIRSIGDSKTPVIFLGIASLLNIVLDIFFITVFRMDVMGAAAATVLAQGVSGLLCLWYIKKKFPILHPRKEHLRANRWYIKKLCTMGIPMGLQYSITAIGGLILQTAVNSLGTLYVAAVATGGKTSMMFCCVFDALGTTIATYSGQNIGAGKTSRVRQGVGACMLLGSVWAVFALLLYIFAGHLLASLFVDRSNTELIALVRRFLITNSLFYIPLAGVNIYRYCIQGIGYSQMAILSGAMELIGRALVGLIFVPAFGFAAVCMANPMAWIAADLFLIPAYLHYTKKLAHLEPATANEARASV